MTVMTSTVPGSMPSGSKKQSGAGRFESKDVDASCSLRSLLEYWLAIAGVAVISHTEALILPFP